MKTRWESFVFVLLMLFPGVRLLNTATRSDAPVAANSVPHCFSSTQTTADEDEHEIKGAQRKSMNAQRVLPSKDIHNATGKTSK